jgi:hypothetical protein
MGVILGTDKEVVRAAKGNPGSTTILFAKQPEILIRSELSEAN